MSLKSFSITETCSPTVCGCAPSAGGATVIAFSICLISLLVSFTSPARLFISPLTASRRCCSATEVPPVCLAAHAFCTAQIIACISDPSISPSHDTAYLLVLLFSLSSLTAHYEPIFPAHPGCAGLRRRAWFQDSYRRKVGFNCQFGMITSPGRACGGARRLCICRLTTHG